MQKYELTINETHKDILMAALERADFELIPGEEQEQELLLGMIRDLEPDVHNDCTA